MKYIFLIIISIVFCYSCKNSKNKYNIHSALIDSLSREDPYNFSFYDNIIIFCKCDNRKIGYLDVYGLNKNFNIPKYNKLGYPRYISEVINLNLVIDSLSAYLSFSLNDTIAAEYNEIQFNKFLAKYTDVSSVKNEYRLTNDLSYNSTLTVLYYLYQNNYYSSFDDYLGFFYSRKGLPVVDKAEVYPILEFE